jgi:hypothetical protein
MLFDDLILLAQCYDLLVYIVMIVADICHVLIAIIRRQPLLIQNVCGTHEVLVG